MKKVFRSALSIALSVCAALLCLPLSSISSSAEKGEENLALHKTYKIKSDACTDYSGPACEKGKKDMLTDGIYGDTKDYYGGKWAHFVKGFGRSITVDLESVCAVDKVQAYFIQHKDDGIYCPVKTDVYLSENGSDFQKVDSVESPVRNTENGYIRVEFLSETKKYKARYVRIHFDVQVNLFIDEIEVYGSKDTKGASELKPDFSDKEESKEDFYFDNRKELGVRDIICFHNGYNDDPSVVCNKREIFKPYIGYVDPKGVYKDTLLDAVMFLTSMGRAPSGGSYIKPGTQTLVSDWEYLLDNTFGKDINVCALDEETGNMKKQLNLPDSYKVAVYLTAPYPKISDTVVGDYKGDSEDDKIENFDDCVTAYMWYVEHAKERFESFDFKNVELKGFFWLSEAIDEWENDYEKELAFTCVKKMHELGVQSVFIPSWQAPGSDIAHEVGFDAVIMQPNLSFMDFAQKDPEAFMQDFIKTAGKYHFGIQLEMMDNIEHADKKYIDFYEQYLYSAYGSGMMKGALHAYYQGAGNGSSFYQCAYSDNPKLRWLYDCNYKFVKGTLDLSDDEKTIGTTEITVKPGETVFGDFSMSNDSYNNIKVSKRADKGHAFYLPAESRYMYRAGRDFTGEDSFTLKITYKSGKEESVEIKVKADPSSEQDKEISSENKDENGSGPDVPKKKNTNLYIALGIVGAVAVCAAAAFAFIHKKKKKNK